MGTILTYSDKRLLQEVIVHSIRETFDQLRRRHSQWNKHALTARDNAGMFVTTLRRNIQSHASQFRCDSYTLAATLAKSEMWSDVGVLSLSYRETRNSISQLQGLTWEELEVMTHKQLRSLDIEEIEDVDALLREMRNLLSESREQEEAGKQIMARGERVIGNMVNTFRPLARTKAR